jgi:hypothetical protein
MFSMLHLIYGWCLWFVMVRVCTPTATTSVGSQNQIAAGDGAAGMGLRAADEKAEDVKATITQHNTPLNAWSRGGLDLMVCLGHNAQLFLLRLL